MKSKLWILTSLKLKTSNIQSGSRVWLFSREQIDISVNESTVYLVIGVLVFGLSDEMLYMQIEREKYRHNFRRFRHCQVSYS
jgi:hypothetical protein